MVHDRAGGRDQEAFRCNRLERRQSRSLRNQRGLCGRHHGGDERARLAAREGQHSRGRLRARPPDRRVGRAHSRHPDRRAPEDRRQARNREPLHRRRRGDRDGDRDRMMPAPIEFYFDFSSPYGYLAGEKIDALAAKYRREVTWRPFLLGVAFKTTGGAPLPSVPMKGPYSLRDMIRTAKYLGVRSEERRVGKE